MKEIQLSVSTTLEQSGYNVNYRHFKGGRGETVYVEFIVR